MSGSAVAWTVTGVALAVVAVGLLIRRLRQGDAACRWLAAVAVVWGAAFATQGASAGDITPAVIQLTLTDLLALCGLPLLVVALLRMAPVQVSSADAARSDRAVDGALLALGLFAIGWIVVLRHAYTATDVGPGFFAVDLIHPVADLLVLGGTLWLAVRAGRPGLTLYAALFAATVGDFLAVQARASGMQPGAWPQLAWLVAICLLGAAGLTGTGPSRARQPMATALSLTAAGAGGLVTLIFSIVSWGRPGALPLVAGAVLILALVARVGGMLRQAAAGSARLEQVAGQFHQLADRTSDVVLLCDRAGVIRYASKAVAHYGYLPDSLTGTRLPDLIHPDDLAGIRLAAAAASGDVACRVRAADGTWRHVQGTVSRYSEGTVGDIGGRTMLLVTARDISDQVALRQQVTQLTFHDGLTGLPNRAYVEERAKDQSPVGAIFADLDGFTAINDSVGHRAGDLVLAQAGRRLRAVVPAHDT
ncbi:MAG: GGDEF domain-containing protein, partial [Actinobacteria bacterium]|nr:GGDEF domain-containing protein [Actinomycetota bacterium]